VPFSDRGFWPQLATAAGLAAAMRRFKRVTLIVAEDPEIMPTCMRAVVYGSRRCTVTRIADAGPLAEHYRLRPGSVDVTEVGPYPMASAATVPDDAGLYRPGGEAGLVVVELPGNTVAQRLRARAQRGRAGVLRRLLGR